MPWLVLFKTPKSGEEMPMTGDNCLEVTLTTREVLGSRERLEDGDSSLEAEMVDAEVTG